MPVGRQIACRRQGGGWKTGWFSVGTRQRECLNSKPFKTYRKQVLNISFYHTVHKLKVMNHSVEKGML